MKVSYKVLFMAILATAGTNAFAADSAIATSGLATTNYVTTAIDNRTTVVHTTGAETIGGVKTFSDGIVANVTGNVSGTAGALTAAATATAIAAAVDSASDAKYATEKAVAKAIAGVSGDLGTVTGDVTTLKSQMTTAQTNISTLQTTTGTHTTEIGQLKTAVGDSSSGLVKNVSDLQGDVAAITATANGKQAKSTANYQVGNSTGGWVGIDTAIEGDGGAISVEKDTTNGKAKVKVANAGTNSVGVVKPGTNLSVDANGALSVVTVDSVTNADANKAKPVTSGAVYSKIGDLGKTATNTNAESVAAKIGAIGDTTVKDYVDNKATAAKNAVTASGSNGVNASATNGAVTVTGVNATATVKGVAEFHQTGSGGVVKSVAVSNGVVTTTNAALLESEIPTLSESKISFSADTVSGSIKNLIKDAKTTATNAASAVTNLDVTNTEQGNNGAGVVKYVTQTDGKVAVTKSTVANTEMAKGENDSALVQLNGGTSPVWVKIVNTYTGD